MQVPPAWVNSGGKLVENATRNECNMRCLHNYLMRGVVSTAPGCGCLWFTNNTKIPGKPTISDDSPLRTFLDHEDRSDRPWRAPGTAKSYPCGVFGGNPSGCGKLEGNLCIYGGSQYGPDARIFDFPDVVTTTYKIGSTIETMWGINTNHGGGYSYRLCKLPRNGKADLTEACFQKLPLKFESDKQAIQFDNGTRVYFQGMKTTKGTHPPGSEWMRNPVPSCKPHGEVSTIPHCPQGTFFEPPVPGVFGRGIYQVTPLYAKMSFDWSIVDRVVIPKGLEPGKYVLGWRWDSEQEPQVWANCADIELVE